MKSIVIHDFTGDEPVEETYTQKDIMKLVNKLVELLNFCSNGEFVEECISCIVGGYPFDLDED